MRTKTVLLPLAALAASSAAFAQTPEVIFCEAQASPKSIVPGTLDLVGNPVVSRWKALEDMAVRQDGLAWLVKGRSELGADLEATLTLGAGSTGIMFAQEGQPVAGGVAGELYDFFDTGDPVSWNAAGDIGFSFRSRGGVAAAFEKVVFFDFGAATHTILFQSDDLVVGLIDNPVASSGDERVGNSVGSVNLLNSGEIACVNTPITNCSSTRYPAMYRTVAGVPNGFRQSGIQVYAHANGADPIDTLGLTDSGTSPDGAHWYSEAEVENEPVGSDKVLIVDDVVVMQEGFPVSGSALNLADIFQTRMVPNGMWISRGDYSDDTDWVVLNGARVLETGSALGAETVTDVISGVGCNQLGDWVATCKTNAAEATNEVLVFNSTIIAREGDPIDLDGNGLFDDSCFIGRATNTLSAFNANDVFVTDDLHVYFMCPLTDGLGTDYESASAFGTPDAFLRIRLEAPNGDNKGYCYATAAICPCGNGGNGLGGCDNAQSTGGVELALVLFNPDNSGGGTAQFRGFGFPPASVPTAILIRSPLPEIPPVVFGDAVRCVSTQLLVRLAATSASGGQSIHNVTHGAGAGSFFYQIWYRNNPASFCDPLAAFNLSNGFRATW
jgi:hypothetical protein